MVIQTRVSHLTDSAAVPALHLAQPPHQMHAGADPAAVQLAGPVGRELTLGADEDLTVAAYAPAPGTLAPVRVYLPGSAPIAGHAACSDSASNQEAQRRR